MVDGYAHPDYARALKEYGTPRELPRCGGWVLQRPIPHTEAVDAMGCYPLFCCRDWSGLGADLDEIGDDLVSVTLVVDPFGDYRLEELKACFDMVKVFKQHVVIDLTMPRDQVVSKHHRRRARKALETLVVERCESPLDHLDIWVALYDRLIEKHHISGITAFSRESFAAQFEVPGLSFFRAHIEGNTVGAALRYQCGDVVYAHLAAFSDIGYQLGASYALTWFALDYYSDKARWFDLGGIPGLGNTRHAGLWSYKRGWSRETRPVYICGRILDHRRYETMARANHVPNDGYFPAYRWGEFI